MPTIHRFPTLVWQDQQGTWTAHVCDSDYPAGLGPSAGKAVEQLADYLDWLFAQNPWMDGPDFLDPELLSFKVPVRPEYEADGRRYPCDETVQLSVHAVRGRQEYGLLICALPTLDLRFYYHDPAALRNLVSHYVQQKLEAITPQELSRYLPPRQAVLESINLTVRSRRRSASNFAQRVETLGGVAEALGHPQLRRQFSQPYERTEQVAQLVRLLGKERANVLLVGEPGSGKTTVLVEAVRQLERGEGGAAAARGRRYWQTSAGRLIAGMKYLGQWEERCEHIIAELADTEGVLCVDNLLELVRQGGSAPTNSLAAFFLPYLQRGELRLVAEATPAEVDACRRLLPGLADVFQLLVLPPFGRQEAINVLEYLGGSLQSNLHIELGRGVVGMVYHLFRRFRPYDAFPGKAAAFLALLFEKARQDRRDEVTPEQVLALFINQTGLPELLLRDEIPLVREDVLAEFRRQVIGQDDACQAAATLVTTFKAGLNDPNRPVGVLLFCGPTGVGKTETARALSRYLFGHGEMGAPAGATTSPDRMVRLDMSEYTGWRAGERLLTRPDGEPSELIQKVRQQPFAVVLLDEVEKADPEVFDVLLGVFDEGRLTDRFGRVTRFTSAVIIMTSNLGAGKREAFGFGPAPGVSYESEAMGFFRPEFFNRIDQVVTFSALDAETIRAITRKELGEIAAREGLVRAGVRLDWSRRLEDHVAREGFDERYGARPLQRTLESMVVTPLARHLLDNPEVRRATVYLDVDEQGQLVIRAS
jgi:ATP-dependent Clp protease ATP-binding subunit ClpC